MKRNVAISFVGQDRPGLIQSLADVVVSLSGNWLESRMSYLADKFAGVALVEVDEGHVDELNVRLSALEHLTVIIELTDTAEPALRTRSSSLNIVGPDRTGILNEVTQALAEAEVNVIEMETHIAAAPMSGELTFSADARVEVPDTVDIGDLVVKLNGIADNLGVDILLEEDD
ncbi:MAG: ACT domain-containing protein [Gammaproteobacteria bacterium]|nr:ACT domain-containing protein [Gammaproteobacteria bacterium]